MDMRNKPEIMHTLRASSGPNQRPVIVSYFIFKIISLAMAGLAIWLGYKLFLLGVSGEASIVVNASGIGGHLANAAPGLFFAVGGIIALIVIVCKGVDVKT